MCNTRNTKQRQLILEAVKARKDHPNAEQIYSDVRAIDDRISKGTVYRNLNILVDQGEIHKVSTQPPERYETKAVKHYHLRCSECGAIIDLEIDYKDDLDDLASDVSGFEIKRHHIVFEGICSECAKNENN